MPTSNQKKSGGNAKKPPSKKTESKIQEDSSPPEAPPSKELYGYAPRSDTELDLRLSGFISATRAGKEVAHIPVDMFMAGLFAKNSLPEADLRFSSVVEAVVTIPLNRTVRQLCEELIETYEADRYSDEDGETFPKSQSALPAFSPDIRPDPDEPALEDEDGGDNDIHTDEESTEDAG